MAEDFVDLLERAAAAPTSSAEEIDQINARARRLQRRSHMVGALMAALVAVVVAGLVYVASNGSADRTSVGIDPASSSLVVPDRGRASAQLLEDGSPVWVIRHPAGTVSVVSAASTHRPFGISQLVDWCASSRGLEDPRYGSRWDEFGHKLGGPAPSDLAVAEVREHRRGQLVVGALTDPSRRTRGQPPPGKPCFDSDRARQHPGPDDSVPYTELRRTTRNHPSSDVVSVKDAVVVATHNGTARLCPKRAPRPYLDCSGIPITDFDLALLDRDYTGQTLVIDGDLLLRPHHRGVEQLVFSNGAVASAEPNR